MIARNYRAFLPVLCRDPYALRLSDPIDLALRQFAAEERTHPLRIVDRAILDHLRRLGKLPPPRDGA